MGLLLDFALLYLILLVLTAPFAISVFVLRRTQNLGRSWLAVVPIVNIAALLWLVEMGWWWLLLLWVPLVPLYVSVRLVWELADRSGRSGAWALTGILPFTWYFTIPYLAVTGRHEISRLVY